MALLRRHGVCERVVISSFNPWVLKRVKQIAPEFRTALIAGSRLAVRLFNPAYCDGLHVHHSLLTRRWFWGPAIPKRLVVWTVDQRSDLPRPVPDAVRGIITNYPRRLRPVRRRREWAADLPEFVPESTFRSDRAEVASQSLGRLEAPQLRSPWPAR